MNSALKIALLSLLVGLASSASLESEDVVYFPNPNGDGSLIPAKLTASPDDPEPQLADPNDIKYFLMTK